MNRHDIPKKQAQYLHFKQRLAERYGIVINRYKYKQLCSAVGGKGTRFLTRQSRRVSIFLMDIDGLQIPVVWDAYRGRLVSALPPEAQKEFTA